MEVDSQRPVRVPMLTPILHWKHLLGHVSIIIVKPSNRRIGSVMCYVFLGKLGITQWKQLRLFHQDNVPWHTLKMVGLRNMTNSMKCWLETTLLAPFFSLLKLFTLLHHTSQILHSSTLPPILSALPLQGSLLYPLPIYLPCSLELFVALLHISVILS